MVLSIMAPNVTFSAWKKVLNSIPLVVTQAIAADGSALVCYVELAVRGETPEVAVLFIDFPSRVATKRLSTRRIEKEHPLREPWRCKYSRNHLSR
jgi:hypothetical protein